jgi:hypothetical protein
MDDNINELKQHAAEINRELFEKGYRVDARITFDETFYMLTREVLLKQLIQEFWQQIITQLMGDIPGLGSLIADITNREINTWNEFFERVFSNTSQGAAEVLLQRALRGAGAETILQAYPVVSFFIGLANKSYVFVNSLIQKRNNYDRLQANIEEQRRYIPESQKQHIMYLVGEYVSLITAHDFIDELLSRAPNNYAVAGVANTDTNFHYLIVIEESIPQTWDPQRNFYTFLGGYPKNSRVLELLLRLTKDNATRRLFFPVDIRDLDDRINAVGRFYNAAVEIRGNAAVVFNQFISNFNEKHRAGLSWALG